MPIQRILIVGATSAIATAVARIYAERGTMLFLCGRNAQHLEAICADLRVRGAAAVDSHAIDLTELARLPALLDAAIAAMSGVDVALIAHGTLPDQTACENSIEQTMAAINSNATSTVAIMTLLARHFEQQRQGTLAVISSVAGDRGRASNYVYGASKALVTAFASGLRQRLHRTGVNVLTIKPGFVDTPMTAEFCKGMLWAMPESVAQGIVRAIERRRSVVYLPWFWRPILLVLQLIPESLFKRLSS